MCGGVIEIELAKKLIKENNLSLSRESYSSKSDKNIDFKTSISEIVLDLQNLRKIISENLK